MLVAFGTHPPLRLVALIENERKLPPEGGEVNRGIVLQYIRRTCHIKQVRIVAVQRQHTLCLTH